MKNKLKPLFLKPEQLAIRWGVSPKTLANMRVSGTGPAYIKLKGSVRYPLKTIKGYEVERTTFSTFEARRKIKALQDKHMAGLRTKSKAARHGK